MQIGGGSRKQAWQVCHKCLQPIGRSPLVPRKQFGKKSRPSIKVPLHMSPMKSNYVVHFPEVRTKQSPKLLAVCTPTGGADKGMETTTGSAYAVSRLQRSSECKKVSWKNWRCLLLKRGCRKYEKNGEITFQKLGTNTGRCSTKYNGEVAN